MQRCRGAGGTIPENEPAALGVWRWGDIWTSRRATTLRNLSYVSVPMRSPPRSRGRGAGTSRLSSPTARARCCTLSVSGRRPRIAVTSLRVASKAMTARTASDFGTDRSLSSFMRICARARLRITGYQCLLVVGVLKRSFVQIEQCSAGLTAPRHTVAPRRGIRGRGHLGANTRARPHSSELTAASCRQGRRPSSRRRSPARAGLSPDGGAAHTRAKQRARRERGDSLRRRGVWRERGDRREDGERRVVRGC